MAQSDLPLDQNSNGNDKATSSLQSKNRAKLPAKTKQQTKQKVQNKAQKIQNRDPRQLTTFVMDFDGTLAKNMGHYVLVRVDEVRDGFFPDVSGLPKTIRVPIDDYEGEVGLRIRDHIGSRDELGRFIHGPTLKPVTLSNGQQVVPGYYYFDPERSYEEFRTPGKPENGFLVQALRDKHLSNEPYLMEAAPFLAAALDSKSPFKSRTRAMISTMAGRDPAEGVLWINRMFKQALGIQATTIPQEAIVNLNHWMFSEFGKSKKRFLTELYKEKSERVIQNFETPHYLVFFENNRRFIRETHTLFRHLANRGEFAYPVVPILVNLVEPEVFAHPYGFDWDRSSTEFGEKMYRVTMYLPGQEIHSDHLPWVFEVTLGVSPDEANALYNKYITGSYCRNILEPRK